MNSTTDVGTTGGALSPAGPDAGPLAEVLRAPFAASVRINDPRLGPALTEPVRYWLRDRDASTTVADIAVALFEDLTRVVSPEDTWMMLGYDLARAQADAHAWAAEILAWEAAQRALTLEEVLTALIAGSITPVATARRARKPISPQWIHAIGARVGAWGRGPLKLDEAAATVGVSRERVRQVQAQVEQGLAPFQPVWIPQLDAVADVVRERPRGTDEFIGELQSRGLTAGRFDVRALTSVAVFAQHPLVVEPVAGVVGAPPGAAHALTRAAFSLTTLPGVATVDQAEALAQSGCESPVTAELARLVIDLDSSLRWCDEQHSVFRGAATNPDRTRLRNIARSMLSVAQGPVAVEDIRRGYERKNTMRTRQRSVAPGAVRAFLMDHPEFQVQGDVVTLTAPVDHHDVLGQGTSIMADILLAAPGNVMDRTSLLDACVAGGMSANTAAMWMSFHEIIVNYGWSVWGLVGASPSPARVAALQEAMRSQFERSQFTDGWDAQGRPWFTVRVTKAFLRSGVLSMTWHPHLAGRVFEVVLADGRYGGQVSFSDRTVFVWGWSLALAQLAVTGGHLLTATFDVNSDTVQVAVN